MALKVNLKTLLEAGCHYGHQTRRWNPKMKPYIFGARNDIYILDLKKTILCADKAYSFLHKVASKGGTVLFVGTKKQAQEAIVSEATRAASPYVSNRWLGGLLTNFVTMRSRVEYMQDLRAMQEDGRMEVLPKKEQALLMKEYEKLMKNLGGVQDMKRLPDALFVVDTKREEIAIKEARRLGILVVGIIDTNSDPDMVDFGIPANDDAIRSIALMCQIAAEAVLSGKSKAQISAEEMVKDTPKMTDKKEVEVLDLRPVKKDKKTTEVIEDRKIEAITTPDLAEKTPRDEKKETKEEVK